MNNHREDVEGWSAEACTIYLRSNDRPPEQEVLECIADTIETLTAKIAGLEGEVRWYAEDLPYRRFRDRARAALAKARGEA